MEKCNICDKEFTSHISVQRHVSRTHKMSGKEYHIIYELNGVQPTCKCGCGELTKWNGHEFLEWKRGHISRVKNNFNTDKSKLNSTNTRRERFTSGEITTWNKGLTVEDSRVRDNIDKVMANQERGNNISKALTGKPKSAEHVQKITENHRKYWADETHRDEQRLRRTEYLQNKPFNKESKLETYFKQILDGLKIEYTFQYGIDGYLFDFLIKDTNILIEVDGDWYHCNPSVYKKPLYETQFDVMKNDKIKNELAVARGYRLIRFWEYDIRNNINTVIEQLNNIKTDIYY